MSWTTTRDPDAFRATAGGFLRSRPAEHTVLLTVSEALRAQGPGRYGDAPPWFGWWRDDDGRVRAALLHTPPRPVQLSPLPAAAVAPLAALLASAAGAPEVVDLPHPAAAAFAAAWGGEPATVHRRRLYRLEALTAPRPAPPGRARTAHDGDLALLLQWMTAFKADLGESGPASVAIVGDRLSHGGHLLWELPDGTPVAVASVTRRVAGAVRVVSVYTPPGHRRHGYGAAVTAEATRRALAQGAGEVVLFTDPANSTSNALYRRIGYRAVAERVALRLRAAPAG